MFDPGGSTGRLRACPFLGEWSALLCGKVFFFFVRAPDAIRGWSVFWQKDDLGVSFSRERYKRLVRIAVDGYFSAERLV